MVSCEAKTSYFLPFTFYFNLPPCAITAFFDILYDNLRKKRLRYGQVNLAASELTR